MINKFLRDLKRTVRDSKGVTALEYAVIAAAIVLAVSAAVTAFGENIQNTFESLGTVSNTAG